MRFIFRISWNFSSFSPQTSFDVKSIWTISYGTSKLRPRLAGAGGIEEAPTIKEQNSENKLNDFTKIDEALMKAL